MFAVIRTEYQVVVFDELSSLDPRFGWCKPKTTLAAAVKSLHSATDYIVAIQDGVRRPLNEREEARLREIRAAKLGGTL